MAALLTLGGCGASADDTTCGEYNGMDSEDKTSSIRSLLSEHDLVEDDTSNIRDLSGSVGDYCAANPDGKMGDGADWCASSWVPKDKNSITCYG